jgi:hypothetical protein
MAAATTTKGGFEVFYPHDEVNTWLDCEIIDIVSGSFKVRLLPRFSSL